LFRTSPEALAASRCSKQASLAINSTEKFLTGNVGGGLKWYAPNGIWGQRGDYRFVAAESKTKAGVIWPGRAIRASRLYGAVIINAIR